MPDDFFENRCRKCGMELYSEEPVCPNCGKRIRKAPSIIFWFAFFFVLFLLVLTFEK